MLRYMRGPTVNYNLAGNFKGLTRRATVAIPTSLYYRNKTSFYHKV